jgi:3-phenylpropionate/cinnamic acid dioxygenase small subunit
MDDMDRAELRRLRDEVRALRDREEIVDCVYRYARGLDRHDADIFASAYHADAIDHHGPFLGRRDEFVRWGIDLLASEWNAHTHFITNVRVELNGDTAHSECYVFFAQRRRDSDVVNLGGGRYLDRLERREETWRIAARELVVDWTAQAQTTDFGETDAYPPGTWDKRDPSYRRPLTLPDPEASQREERGRR